MFYIIHVNVVGSISTVSPMMSMYTKPKPKPSSLQPVSLSLRRPSTSLVKALMVVEHTSLQAWPTEMVLLVPLSFTLLRQDPTPAAIRPGVWAVVPKGRKAIQGGKNQIHSLVSTRFMRLLVVRHWPSVYEWTTSQRLRLEEVVRLDNVLCVNVKGVTHVHEL